MKLARAFMFRIFGDDFIKGTWGGFKDDMLLRARAHAISGFVLAQVAMRQQALRSVDY